MVAGGLGHRPWSYVGCLGGGLGGDGEKTRGDCETRQEHRTYGGGHIRARPPSHSKLSLRVSAYAHKHGGVSIVRCVQGLQGP